MLKVSRGSVYYLPKPVSETYMALMRRMGIEALAPQPGTSKAALGNKIYPYLLRKLDINSAKQPWALDTTYIPMVKGFVYLTAVVDVSSRRVLTHKVDVTLGACHAREIIEEAFARYGVSEIVNTDQGSQFTTEEFTHAVLSKGVKLSMDGRVAWRDKVQSAEPRRCVRSLPSPEQVSSPGPDAGPNEPFAATSVACLSQLGWLFASSLAKSPNPFFELVEIQKSVVSITAANVATCG